jgi:hypothetical protein
MGCRVEHVQVQIESRWSKSNSRFINCEQQAARCLMFAQGNKPYFWNLKKSGGKSLKGGRVE